jgi:hypothetical protein
MPEMPQATFDPDDGSGETGSTDRNSVEKAGIERSIGGDYGNAGTSGGSGGGHTSNAGMGEETSSGGQGKRTPGTIGGKPFISYLGTHPDDEERDPDGLDQAKRMDIEAQAIDLIISLEPTLKRTPPNNPGFDLYEGEVGQEIRLVEVKSMTGCLDDRPVGISRTQFECAREKGGAYWLYVVEHATDPKRAKVLRIQNPVKCAQTFTFDQGWREIALTDPPESFEQEN